jgi:hypothetical protein
MKCSNDGMIKDHIKVWRKQNAVIGFLYSSIQYNCTGDVQYYYGGSVAVTHYEKF